MELLIRIVISIFGGFGLAMFWGFAFNIPGYGGNVPLDVGLAYIFLVFLTAGLWGIAVGLYEWK